MRDEDDDGIAFGYEDEDGNIVHPGYDDDEDEGDNNSDDDCQGQASNSDSDDNDPRQNDHDAYKKVQRKVAEVEARYNANPNLADAQEARGLVFEYAVHQDLVNYAERRHVGKRPCATSGLDDTRRTISVTENGNRATTMTTKTSKKVATSRRLMGS